MTLLWRPERRFLLLLVALVVFLFSTDMHYIIAVVATETFNKTNDGTTSSDGNSAAPVVNFYLESSDPNSIHYSQGSLTPPGSIDFSQLQWELLQQDNNKNSNRVQPLDLSLLYLDLVILHLPNNCTMSQMSFGGNSGCHWSKDLGLGFWNENYHGGSPFWCCTPALMAEQQNACKSPGDFIVNDLKKLEPYGRHIRVPLHNNSTTPTSRNPSNATKDDSTTSFPFQFPPEIQHYSIPQDGQPPLINATTTTLSSLKGDDSFVVLYANCNNQYKNTWGDLVLHGTGQVVWKSSLRQNDYDDSHYDYWWSQNDNQEKPHRLYVYSILTALHVGLLLAYHGSYRWGLRQLTNDNNHSSSASLSASPSNAVPLHKWIIPSFIDATIAVCTMENICRLVLYLVWNHHRTNGVLPKELEHLGVILQAVKHTSVLSLVLVLSSGIDAYRKPLSQAATVYLILLGAYHIIAFVDRNNTENHFEVLQRQEQEQQLDILSPLERMELVSDVQCWKNIVGFTDFVFMACSSVALWRTIGYQTQQLNSAMTGTTTMATEIRSAAILLQRYQLFLALIVLSLVVLILRQGLPRQSHPALEETNYAVLVFGAAFLWWPTATMLKGYHGILGDDPEVHHVELEAVVASAEDSKAAGSALVSNGEEEGSIFQHEHAR